MLAKLKTFSLLGIDALPVEVEVHVSPAGLPKTLLLGIFHPKVRAEKSPREAERDEPRTRKPIHPPE
jgi:magnesium chelatase family protein